MARVPIHWIWLLVPVWRWGILKDSFTSKLSKQPKKFWKNVRCGVIQINIWSVNLYKRVQWPNNPRIVHYWHVIFQKKNYGWVQFKATVKPSLLESKRNPQALKQKHHISLLISLPEKKFSLRHWLSTSLPRPLPRTLKCDRSHNINKQPLLTCTCDARMRHPVYLTCHMYVAYLAYVSYLILKLSYMSMQLPGTD